MTSNEIMGIRNAKISLRTSPEPISIDITRFDID